MSGVDARAPEGDSRLRDDLLHLLWSLDLTTLAGDDTGERVRVLCRRARSPVPGGLAERLGENEPGRNRVAAVCVFPAFIEEAREALEGSSVPVATVSGGFPHGLSRLSDRVREVASALEAGADEIDVVIRREWALGERWERLYEEVRAMREAAGPVTLKVILGTGEMESLDQVARSALVAALAGADFVKTSTGKERVNATLPAGLAMARAVATCERETGRRVGLKPAGGIRKAEEGLAWLHLVREELGEEAATPDRFRVGASSLLDSLVARLDALAPAPSGGKSSA